jgi:hypothetical protein
VDVATLGARLRSEVNRPLSRFARRAGLLSTPFKRMGIFGWRDSGLWVVAVGEVVQVAWSTDGFVTADLRLEGLTVAGEKVALPGTRYLRAEICERAIGLAKTDRPRAGGRVRLAGRLMWDGDGWFEVHPQTRDGVAVLSSTTADCDTTIHLIPPEEGRASRPVPPASAWTRPQAWAPD